MMKNTRRLKNISYIFSVGKLRAILENEQIEKKLEWRMSGKMAD